MFRFSLFSFLISHFSSIVLSFYRSIVLSFYQHHHKHPLRLRPFLDLRSRSADATQASYWREPAPHLRKRGLKYIDLRPKCQTKEDGGRGFFGHHGSGPAGQCSGFRYITIARTRTDGKMWGTQRFGGNQEANECRINQVQVFGRSPAPSITFRKQGGGELSHMFAYSNVALDRPVRLAHPRKKTLEFSPEFSMLTDGRLDGRLKVKKILLLKIGFLFKTVTKTNLYVIFYSFLSFLSFHSFRQQISKEASLLISSTALISTPCEPFLW